jgi:hypothetical protein
MELTFHESGFEGRWKKGLEPGELKQKWNAVLVEDKNPTNESKNGYHIFTDEDNIRYEGEWKNDEFVSGKAEYVDEDGEKVIEEGEFKDFTITSGKITYQNGMVEEGYFDEEGVLHGQGKQTYFDEDGVKVIEEGIFEQGNLKEGKITWADGNTASGTFDEELELNGKGIYTWANGDFQDGTWVHGEFKDGKAKITHEDGEISEGIMKDGEWVEEEEVLDTEEIKSLESSEFNPKEVDLSINLNLPKLKMSDGFEEIIYYGEVEDGFPKGKGVLVFSYDECFFCDDFKEDHFEEGKFVGMENIFEFGSYLFRDSSCLTTFFCGGTCADGQIIYPDKTKYVGSFDVCCWPPKPGGEGCFYDQNDTLIISGVFTNGKFENQNSELIFDNLIDEAPKPIIEENSQYKFVGHKKNNGEIIGFFHGKGSIEYFESGCKYDGEFKDGEKSGKGTFIWPDGQKYEGDFLNDYLHGKGTYIWPSGQQYIGDWIKGKRKGKGILTLANGQRYEGDFLNDIYHGFGKLLESNGSWKEGTWENDEFIAGKVYIIYESGNTYQGDYSNNTRNGKGIYTWPDGQKYEGEFLNGNSHGFGKQVWPNGQWEEGTWENDEFISGKGRWIFDSGDTYEGERSQGAWNGKGKYKWANGNSYEGNWENGKMLGKTNFELKDEQRERDDRKYREEKSGRQREEDELARKKVQEKKEKKEKEEKEKTKPRWFGITYNIKLKEDKNQTTYASSYFDAMLNGGMSKTEKTHGKGQLIQRKINVLHEGQTLSDSSAKNYIVQKDADVKSGKAGTSTITIIKIN